MIAGPYKRVPFARIFSSKMDSIKQITKDLYSLVKTVSQIERVDIEECPVCCTNEANWELTCQHRLCLRCISNLGDSPGTCPYCRSKIYSFVKLTGEFIPVNQENNLATDEVLPPSPLSDQENALQVMERAVQRVRLPSRAESSVESLVNPEIEEAMANMETPFLIWGTIKVAQSRQYHLCNWPPSAGIPMTTYFQRNFDPNSVGSVYFEQISCNLNQLTAEMPQNGTVFIFKCANCLKWTHFKRESARSARQGATNFRKCGNLLCKRDCFNGVVRIWRPRNDNSRVYYVSL
jgi:hypothetical protein